MNLNQLDLFHKITARLRALRDTSRSQYAIEKALNLDKAVEALSAAEAYQDALDVVLEEFDADEPQAVHHVKATPQAVSWWRRWLQLD